MDKIKKFFQDKINNLFLFIEKYNLYSLIIILFLFIIYTPEGFVKLGLYSDDWVTRAHPIFIKEHSLIGFYSSTWINPVSWYRPVAPFIAPFLSWIYYISGYKSYIFYFILIIFDSLIFILFYRFIEKILNNKLLSLLIVLMGMLFIGKATLFYWYATIPQHFALIFFFLGCNWIASRKNINLFSLFILFLCGLISGFSYEYYIAITIFLPLILYVFKKFNFKSILKIFFTLFLSTFIIAFYKKYGFTLLFHFSSVKDVSFGSRTAITILLDSSRVFKQIGGYLFTFRNLEPMKYLLTFLDIKAIFWSILGTIIFMLITIKSKVTKIEFKKILVIGIIGLVSFSLINSIFATEVYITGRGDRSMVSMSIFIGISIFGLIGYFFNKKIFVLIMSIIMFFSILTYQLIRYDYQYSWEVQQKLLVKIKKDLEPEVLKINKPYFIGVVLPLKYVVTEFGTPLISDFWTADSILKYCLNNDYIYSDIIISEDGKLSDEFVANYKYIRKEKVGTNRTKKTTFSVKKGNAMLYKLGY